MKLRFRKIFGIVKSIDNVEEEIFINFFGITYLSNSSIAKTQSYPKTFKTGKR
jgi:hypothetical protein